MAAVTTRVWDGQAGRYRSVPIAPAPQPIPVKRPTPTSEQLKAVLRADARTHLSRMFGG